MDGASTFADNSKETTQEPKLENPPTEKSREELIAELTQTIDDLFDPINIVHNTYFVTKAQNDHFEVPVSSVYNEWSIKGKTLDKQLINKALDQSKNVVVNKQGDYVYTVMPKTSQLKRRIVIDNIPQDRNENLKDFVYNIENDMKGKILSWNHNYKYNFVNIICIDEAFASHLLEILSTKEFEGETLKCTLTNDILYKTACDIMRKRNKGHATHAPQMYPYNAYNTYPMQPFYPPYSNYYIPAYPNMNYYYPMQSPMYMPILPTPTVNPNTNPNPNPNPIPNKKPYNPNYKNDRKPYVKRGKQSKEKNFKYSNRLSTKSSSIEVNDNEFPPL